MNKRHVQELNKFKHTRPGCYIMWNGFGRFLVLKRYKSKTWVLWILRPGHAWEKINELPTAKLCRMQAIDIICDWLGIAR